MEGLLESPTNEYPPETIYEIRKLLNLEQPGRMKEAVEILEEWIQKQEHFESKEFDRNSLEVLIINCKGSLETAKQKIDKLCTLRTLMPEFFTAELMELKINQSICHYNAMPKLTADYYKILVFKFKPGKQTSEDQLVASTDFFHTHEYLLRNSYFVGYKIIHDYRETNIKDMLAAVNLTNYRNLLNIYQEGYGFRINEMHVLSNSKLIENLVTIVKPILTPKIRSRIIMHSSLDSLHKMVPRELLCKDLGGDEPSMAELNDLRIQRLSSKEHIEYMKKLLKQRTNESKRIGGKITIDDLPGTFRGLNVD